MPEMQPSVPAYALGYTPEGFQRLLVQGRLYRPFMQRLLAAAGLSAGMHVLDVGCGPGEVSLLAAELVGELGMVIGVDRDESTIRIARGRAQEAGLKNVSFLLGDLNAFTSTQSFDAIIGRCILIYLPQPAAVLRQLATRLRPGGVLAFQEYDLSSQSDATLPACPLWEQTIHWGIQAFQRIGIECRIGMKLASTFREAGLPTPHLSYEASISASPEWEGYEVFAGSIRDVLPVIQRFGIATAEDIEVETLAARLREEVASAGGVARLPALVSAWTRVGEA